MDQNDLKKYLEQKKAAKRRKIDFNLTFEEWYNWWQQTGHYNERGSKKGQYCMCRKNDIGAYEIGNIYCDLTSNNSRVAHKGKILTEETKQKMRKPKSEAHRMKIKTRIFSETHKMNMKKAKPILTCPHCSAQGGGHALMYRWHFDNCKRKAA